MRVTEKTGLWPFECSYISANEIRAYRNIHAKYQTNRNMETFIRCAVPKRPLYILIRFILSKGIFRYWCLFRTQTSVKLVFNVKSYELNVNLSFGAYYISGCAHRQLVSAQVTPAYQGWNQTVFIETVHLPCMPSLSQWVLSLTVKVQNVLHYL